MAKRPFVDRLRAMLPQGSRDTLVRGSVEPAGASARRVTQPVPHACGVTDPGRVRTHNEDAFHIADAGRLLVVADGMGGHRAGEVAAALAVEAVVGAFDAARERSVAEEREDAADVLSRAFDAAHSQVQGAADQHPEWSGMGTTLIAGYVVGDVLHTCHVGDVRCYIHRGHDLATLTHDHSVVGALLRAGKLSPDEAHQHPRRNEILQAVGVARTIDPERQRWTLAPGDVVLLCSDGLWEMLGEVEMAAVLGGPLSLAERAVRLVELANEAGGRDNVTVVLYEHPPPASA
jgi:PPM family protein phosphatase